MSAQVAALTATPRQRAAAHGSSTTSTSPSPRVSDARPITAPSSASRRPVGASRACSAASSARATSSANNDSLRSDPSAAMSSG